MKDFVPVKDIPKYEGKKVKIRGWVYRKRDQKKIVFIILRDSSGLIQIAAKDIPEAQKATIESSIIIEGKVKKDDRAPSGYEISADKVEIVGLAERFPIGKDISDEFTRDVRHLWVRSRYITSILKVRSEVFKAIREFYSERGFFEVQAPSFTASACEGGSTLFAVKYFDKEVYLTQSWQLYAEAMIHSLEKIFTIAPSYRAEKSRTIRHLAEYWHHEMEVAWMDHDEMMEFEEDLIIYIVKHVLKHCEAELKELERDTSDLKAIKKPFMKISYKDAMKKMKKPATHDITDKEERKLIEDLGSKPVFLTGFPRKMKAFYMKVDPKDKKYVLASDLLLPGIGEVVGGSQRIDTLDELKESMKLFKLKEKDYAWYMDLLRYGAVPHSGFGLGVERIVMWLTGAKHVMDTIPFPRTMDRVYP
ncbi:MAG: asparagine--tRNA ligase [Candidatus Aenigmarchaeota archaeon]|nr:asparagine--tRNA ligase [Candidatus Aenigmarchaeota archaeon]